MNIRKPVDYNAMFKAAVSLPQMELYSEIGRLVSGRPEKGAAVAVAEYLRGTYLNAAGFSPRNLRRMRDFYKTYEDSPDILAEAMTIGWTQNVVILESELTLQERAWYIQTVQKHIVKAGASAENCVQCPSRKLSQLGGQSMLY